MKPNQKPERKPRPVGIAYDAHFTRMVILCDDGSIWERQVMRDERGQIEPEPRFKWVKIDDFRPE